MTPVPQGHAQPVIPPLRAPSKEIPILQEQEIPVNPVNSQHKLIEDPRILQQMPTITQHKISEDPRLIHQIYHEPNNIAPQAALPQRGVRQQSLEVPRTVNKQEERMLGCIPRIGSTDTRMYGMGGCSSNKG
jgi:hypothetical protein